MTSSLSSSEHPDASEDIKGVASTPTPVCTSVCTSEAKNVNADTPEAGQAAGSSEDSGQAVAAEAPAGGQPGGQDPLAALADAIAALSPADRMRLAKMLGSQ